MSAIPDDLRYAKTHEWIRAEPAGTVLIGITDYAQQSLGDITFVQLPPVGAALVAGQPFGVIESVKAASDLYAPVSGRVVAVNPVLATSPDILNAAPYGAGWLLRVQPTETPELLDAAAYCTLTA